MCNGFLDPPNNPGYLLGSQALGFTLELLDLVQDLSERFRHWEFLAREVAPPASSPKEEAASISKFWLEAIQLVDTRAGRAGWTSNVDPLRSQLLACPLLQRAMDPMSSRVAKNQQLLGPRALVAETMRLFSRLQLMQ